MMSCAKICRVAFTIETKQSSLQKRCLRPAYFKPVSGHHCVELPVIMMSDCRDDIIWLVILSFSLINVKTAVQRQLFLSVVRIAPRYRQ